MHSYLFKSRAKQTFPLNSRAKQTLPFRRVACLSSSNALLFHSPATPCVSFLTPCEATGAFLFQSGSSLFFAVARPCHAMPFRSFSRHSFPALGSSSPCSADPALGTALLCPSSAVPFYSFPAQSLSMHFRLEADHRFAFPLRGLSAPFRCGSVRPQLFRFTSA